MVTMVAAEEMPRLSLIAAVNTDAASLHNTATHLAKPMAVIPGVALLPHIAPVQSASYLHVKMALNMRCVDSVHAQGCSRISCLHWRHKDRQPRRCGADPVPEVVPTSGEAAPVNAVEETAVPTAASTAMMHDCSNDDSGLPLAQLKVEQTWTSAAARQPWDVTLVTQLSPGRRAALPC